MNLYKQNSDEKIKYNIYDIVINEYGHTFKNTDEMYNLFIKSKYFNDNFIKYDSCFNNEFHYYINRNINIDTLYVLNNIDINVKVTHLYETCFNYITNKIVSWSFTDTPFDSFVYNDIANDIDFNKYLLLFSSYYCIYNNTRLDTDVVYIIYVVYYIAKYLDYSGIVYIFENSFRMISYKLDIQLVNYILRRIDIARLDDFINITYNEDEFSIYNIEKDLYDVYVLNVYIDRKNHYKNINITMYIILLNFFIITSDKGGLIRIIQQYEYFDNFDKNFQWARKGYEYELDLKVFITTNVYSLLTKTNMFYIDHIYHESILLLHPYYYGLDNDIFNDYYSTCLSNSSDKYYLEKLFDESIKKSYTYTYIEKMHGPGCAIVSI